MGRSKLNTSLKSNTPIPLPHDGPIHVALNSENQQMIDDSILRAAYQLCSDENGNSAEANLFRSLRSAKTSKEQIQKLQSYKNNNKNNKKNDSSAKEGPEKVPEALHTETIALYRLMLEWSLSIQTTVPLRRTTQSIISQDDKTIVEVSKNVLASFWSTKSWKNPLMSLETALNSPILKPILQDALLHDCLTFLHRQYISETLKAKDQSVESVVEVGSRMSEILKLLLDNQEDEISHLEDIRQYTVMLFQCPTFPIDSYNTLGIVYGRLLLCSDGQESLSKTAIEDVKTIDANQTNLSALARLQIVKGIAATLSLDVLIEAESDPQQTPLDACWRYILHVCRTATDPMVRWAALKGLSTLASRLLSLKDSSNSHAILVNETMDVVLQAWENPPLRKIGAAIPSLFESLVKLLQKEELEGLIASILKQPVNRKGRYLALDILLPHMPRNQVIQPESLLEGVGDRGANTGAIADLWKKLLLHFWNQIKEESSTLDECFERWKEQWIPSLSKALVMQGLSRRRQVAAFCLPRVVDMMRKNKELAHYLPRVFVELVQSIGGLNRSAMQIVIDDSETIEDRLLWAHLDVARYASSHKTMTPEVKAAISSHVPESKLRVAVTHRLTSIRVLGFQSMYAIITAYDQSIEAEAALWRYSLSYVARSTDSKEYTSVMLQTLITFLDRYSQFQSKTSQSSGFQTFFTGFLLNDVVVKNGAYPGTVADKEGFMLALLGYLLSFVTQDQSYNIQTTVTKHGVIFNRRRSSEEDSIMLQLLNAFFEPEVFSCLYSLLFSIWDGSRTLAFRFLSKLVVAGQSNKISAPAEFASKEAWASLKARGIYLASSPRQREADTGSRILAFLYCVMDDPKDRVDYVRTLMTLLKARLQDMKDQLRSILDGTGKEKEIATEQASALPLAHGIIQAISLIVEHKKLDTAHGTEHSMVDHSSIYHELLEILVEAIQVSLAVVADVREGETVEGVEDSMDFVQKKDRGSSVPLNVNTGAIGANGTFSSVSTKDDAEFASRLAVQRVVIGSWLLTKETCSCISSVISVEGFQARLDAFERIGALLISTLTTLKHAGAAFAARDSLQVVVAVALRSECNGEIVKLPLVWAKRLVAEISTSDKVRDSTLRRSTGYALGFLAIMRSELSRKQGQPKISNYILDTLLTLCLPPEDRIKIMFQQLNLDDTKASVDSFFQLSSGRGPSFVPDDKYEVSFLECRAVSIKDRFLTTLKARSRVHALNVLRLIILDAPLVSVVRPLVGSSMVAAILGYDDPSWAVRNSSTMVFSASMLRVVDADKNASNNDSTSSNAITMTELFRRYPFLSTFLLSVMKSCVRDISANTAEHSRVFPIVLMLSRLQPISKSGEASAGYAEDFIEVILQCLRNKHHAIRAAAARSVATLCSDSNRYSKKCLEMLSENLATPKKDWNEIDGILLCLESLSTSFSVLVENVGEIESTLLKFVLPNESARSPPSCSATAIRILWSIDRHQQVVQDSPDVHALKTLSKVCEGIVHNGRISSFVGGSDLHAICAAIFTEILDQSIWSPKDLNEMDKGLKQLHGLLSSNIYDVRLAAAKAFKKRIYSRVDELVEKSDISEEVGSGPPPSQVLSKVASTILSAVQRELSRESDGGSHPPTIRRLSRCFLECFYGFKELQGDPSSFLSPSEMALVWTVATSIAQRESMSDEGHEECNGETFASSNAVEMMAVVLATKNPLLAGSELSERMSAFLKTIQRLNDPQASWRSRHSASLGIETSGVLAPTAETSTTAGMQDVRKAILRQTLGMLQDFDPDVRATATRAVYQMGNAAVAATPSQLPQLMLEDACLKVYSSGAMEGNLHSTYEHLKATLAQNYSDVLAAMQSFEDEASKSSGTSTADPGLLNVTTNRKIFEQEDPNPNNEKVLASQLAIQSLLHLSKNMATGDIVFLDELFQLCSSCLAILDRIATVGGVAHDCTRFPFIFPGLHGLLQTVSLAVYLGEATKASELKVMAKSIADRVHYQSGASMHPAILHCLTMLSQAQSASSETREALETSCFLLRM